VKSIILFIEKIYNTTQRRIESRRVYLRVYIQCTPSIRARAHVYDPCRNLFLRDKLFGSRTILVAGLISAPSIGACVTTQLLLFSPNNLRHVSSTGSNAFMRARPWHHEWIRERGK